MRPGRVVRLGTELMAAAASAPKHDASSAPAPKRSEHISISTSPSATRRHSSSERHSARRAGVEVSILAGIERVVPRWRLSAAVGSIMRLIAEFQGGRPDEQDSRATPESSGRREPRFELTPKP